MNLCLRCRRRIRTCVCHLIKSFETNSRVIILMHPMEYKKEKVGTGRFCHLILQNSELLVGVDFDRDERFQELLHDPEYQSYVLYPGKSSLDLAEDELLKENKKKQFFLIDGTWPCAKKMMKLTTSLHSLPRVSFQQKKESAFIIKHQPMPGCLSTVESVTILLSELERMKIEDLGEKKQNLLDVFNYCVDLQLQLSQENKETGYRRSTVNPSEMLKNRSISKKWSKRSLFFSER